MEATRLRELASALDNLEATEHHIAHIEQGGDGWRDLGFRVSWTTGCALHGHKELCRAVEWVIQNEWQNILRKAVRHLENEVASARVELANCDDDGELS